MKFEAQKVGDGKKSVGGSSGETGCHTPEGGREGSGGRAGGTEGGREQLHGPRRPLSQSISRRRSWAACIGLDYLHRTMTTISGRWDKRCTFQDQTRFEPGKSSVKIKLRGTKARTRPVGVVDSAGWISTPDCARPSRGVSGQSRTWKPVKGMKQPLKKVGHADPDKIRYLDL